MAGATGSTVTERSRRRSRLCLNRPALWWSNWAPAKPLRSAHYFRARALRRRAHVPTFRVNSAPLSPENVTREPGKGHDHTALDPGKKALGISAGTDYFAGTESARNNGAAQP